MSSETPEPPASGDGHCEATDAVKPVCRQLATHEVVAPPIKLQVEGGQEVTVEWRSK
jgi:hypothetical protein